MAFVPETNTLILSESDGVTNTTVVWTSESELSIDSVQLEVSNPDPDSSPLEELTPLTITFSGGSFTFTGEFTTWFSRRVTFVVEEGVIDKNMTYSFNNQVSKPSLLPDSFYAAHRVESPPAFLTLTFTITGTETIIVEGDDELGIPPTSKSSPFEEQWVCTVRHDYDANIVAVREAVQKGDAFKRYEDL